MTGPLWVDCTGIHPLVAENPPTQVGVKAEGLLSIPPAWTPPFVVVSPELFRDFTSTDRDGRVSLLAEWSARIDEAVAHLSIPGDRKLILRSNAVAETLRDRGLLVSRISTRETLLGDLRGLLEDLHAIVGETDIGLIVQEYVPPQRQGHLSNERRVAEEYRDAEILTEIVKSGEIIEHRIVHRQWRRSDAADESALTCSSPEGIKDKLREPLVLAAQSARRVHYEWVWDGSTLYVVQADRAPIDSSGVHPLDKVGDATKSVAASELKRFRPAASDDAATNRKVRFHLDYMKDGFWQPTFYILDDQEVLDAILTGSVPSGVQEDLAILVRSPLVMRTAYSPEALPLLPRSDQLASVEAAVEWLTNSFADDIREKRLDTGHVSLIAHRYVPALAAAFSHASPRQPTVLIEALWGVPEGLYYYPCDEYHVRTPVEVRRGGGFRGYSVEHYVRFKSHFVAPDEGGRFHLYQVARPADWQSTIAEDETLCRIAEYTRTVADDAGSPITIMWFLGCKTEEGEQEAIPWYQERQETPGGHAAYHRNARDEVLTISTEADLQRLEERPTTDPEDRPGKLTLQLFPSDHTALRDGSFTRRVGEAAVRLNAVVFLRGARLAHIFYVLKRTNAEVVTEPLADPTREAGASHDKLVRDRIPEKVVEGGETVKVASLSAEERLVGLRIKLIEEAFEVRDASGSDLVEELADVQEVVRALIRAAGLTPEDVEAARERKYEDRGGFDEGVFLVETGHDIGELAAPLLAEDEGVAPDLMELSRRRSLETIRHGGAERRRGPGFVELVRDFAASLSVGDWEFESGPMPLREVGHDTVASVMIHARRRGATLRLRVRLWIGGEEQLELPFVSTEDEPPPDQDGDS